MSESQKITYLVARSLKTKSFRQDDFFQECQLNLKKMVCPLIVHEFERALQKIKEHSMGSLAIQRLHLMEHFKKSDRELSDLYFMEIIRISDTPLIDLSEGLSLELNHIKNSIIQILNLKKVA